MAKHRSSPGTCARCSKPKNPTDFCKNKSRPDGLSDYCKPCRKYIRQQARLKDPEGYRMKKREAYKRRSPEEIALYLDYQRKYREEHKQQNAEYQKEYRAAHRQELNEKKVVYISSHPEYAKNRKEWSRRWRENNRERVLARAIKAVHKRRATLAQSGGSFTELEWQVMLSVFGCACLCCGRRDVTLTRDHVVPISRQGRNEIANIQPLCRSCNAKKHIKITDYRDPILLQKVLALLEKAA